MAQTSPEEVLKKNVSGSFDNLHEDEPSGDGPVDANGWESDADILAPGPKDAAPTSIATSIPDSPASSLVVDVAVTPPASVLSSRLPISSSSSPAKHSIMSLFKHAISHKMDVSDTHAISSSTVKVLKKLLAGYNLNQKNLEDISTHLNDQIKEKLTDTQTSISEADLTTHLKSIIRGAAIQHVLKQAQDAASVAQGAIDAAHTTVQSTHKLTSAILTETQRIVNKTLAANNSSDTESTSRAVTLILNNTIESHPDNKYAKYPKNAAQTMANHSFIKAFLEELKEILFGVAKVAATVAVVEAEHEVSESLSAAQIAATGNGGDHDEKVGGLAGSIVHGLSELTSAVTNAATQITAGEQQVAAAVHNAAGAITDGEQQVAVAIVNEVTQVVAAADDEEKVVAAEMASLEATSHKYHMDLEVTGATDIAIHVDHHAV